MHVRVVLCPVWKHGVANTAWWWNWCSGAKNMYRKEDDRHTHACAPYHFISLHAFYFLRICQSIFFIVPG